MIDGLLPVRHLGGIGFVVHVLDKVVGILRERNVRVRHRAFGFARARSRTIDHDAIHDVTRRHIRVSNGVSRGIQVGDDPEGLA
jgi:hypothetical protein